MSQNQFERGKFRAYRATTDIHLGKFQMNIKRDGEFDYDGQTIRYEGTLYEGVPQLQGLLNAWYVPTADKVTQYRSQPANVQVRAATPEGEARGASFSMGRASEEEAVVGTMDQAKEIRTAASSDQARLAQLREQRRAEAARRAGLVDPLQDSNPNAPPPQNAADVDPEAEAALMANVEDNFVRARPVVGVGPTGQASAAELEAVARATALNQERIAQVMALLNEVDPPKTRDQFGGTRHDSTEDGRQRKASGKYTIIRDEQDDGVPIGNYKFSGGATVGNPEDARNAAMARPVDVTRVASQQPVQVGQAVAQTSHRPGGVGAVLVADAMPAPQASRARNTTQIRRGEGNVGIDDIGPNGTTGDVEEAASGDDLSELLPDAAVAGHRVAAQRAVPVPPKKSESEEIQEIVDNWSTKRRWEQRVEEAVEFYGEWPEALEAICGIEAPPVVKKIRERLGQKIAEG